MKTLKTVANLTSDVVKSEGGLELLMSLIEKLQEQIDLKEHILSQDDISFKEMLELELFLLQTQLDLLNQKVWKFK